MVTDDILQDLKEVKKEKLDRLDKQLESTNMFVERIDQVKQEKDDMGVKLK